MILLLTLAVVVALFLCLACLRVHLRIWSPALVVATGALAYAACAPAGVIFGLVGLAAIFAAVLNLEPLRQTLLARPLFALFKRMLPPLSDTERWGSV